jgi:hypothetical protein
LPGRAAPSLAPALARRLDRLSRDAHAFHRFAHHPLCPAYAGEVVRIGPRLRVCRGCLLAVLGALAGGLAGALLPPVAAGPALILLALALVLGLGPWRTSKLLTRFAPLALGGLVAVQGLRADALGLLRALLALAMLLAATQLYRRRGPHRGPCAACPERTGLVACSGLRPIVRRERAFQKLAGRWMRRG